jgi:hypothetical protein
MSAYRASWRAASSGIRSLPMNFSEKVPSRTADSVKPHQYRVFERRWGGLGLTIESLDNHE